MQPNQASYQPVAHVFPSRSWATRWQSRQFSRCSAVITPVGQSFSNPYQLCDQSFASLTRASRMASSSRSATVSSKIRGWTNFQSFSMRSLHARSSDFLLGIFRLLAKLHFVTCTQRVSECSERLSGVAQLCLTFTSYEMFCCPLQGLLFSRKSLLGMALSVHRNICCSLLMTCTSAPSPQTSFALARTSTANLSALSFVSQQ